MANETEEIGDRGGDLADKWWCKSMVFVGATKQHRQWHDYSSSQPIQQLLQSRTTTKMQHKHSHTLLHCPSFFHLVQVKEIEKQMVITGVLVKRPCTLFTSSDSTRFTANFPRQLG